MHIRIKGYTFQITEPFQAGTVLTKGEAQALNGLRAENIQNNLREIVGEETAKLGQGELLPQGTLDSLQLRLTSYDLGYQFVEKHTPRPRKGDIEAEARSIAEEQVASQYRQAGVIAWTLEALEADISTMEKLPAVLEEARARVTAKRAAMQGNIEDL